MGFLYNAMITVEQAIHEAEKTVMQNGEHHNNEHNRIPIIMDSYRIPISRYIIIDIIMLIIINIILDSYYYAYNCAYHCAYYYAYY